jgi:hypothetical protein
MFGILAIIMWVAGSIVIGGLGRDRSCGGLLAFTVSLFLSPMAGILLLYFSKDISLDRELKEFNDMTQKATEIKKEDTEDNSPGFKLQGDQKKT